MFAVSSLATTDIGKPQPQHRAWVVLLAGREAIAVGSFRHYERVTRPSFGTPAAFVSTAAGPALDDLIQAMHEYAVPHVMLGGDQPGALGTAYSACLAAVRGLSPGSIPPAMSSSTQPCRGIWRAARSLLHSLRS
jgi:hypothetical protein